METAGASSQASKTEGAPLFISHASANRTAARDLCGALEKRGIPCWIASRDVAPGENYQEAIVRALRKAPALILVFSAAANESDEIKKELSLASRFKIPVIAVRIEDVEPSDAFAYELSTRQWIDAFSGWNRAMETLARRIADLPDRSGRDGPTSPAPAGKSRGRRYSKGVSVAAALLLVALAAGGWWLLRPAPKTHSMVVRLAGFERLSDGLDPAFGERIDAEVSAAFNADGVVGVSTAAGPPPGSAPAYALGGSVQQDGGIIRVITRLVNERSGATLWTDTVDYPVAEASNVPRHIAVDAGNVVRCGLFGAETYRKALPDQVLKDYLQFCEGHWDTDMSDGRKALVPAQRVVAALPDFSWGWAGVAGAFWKVAAYADSPELEAQARRDGVEAADRALKIDKENSEALWIKSMLIDRSDWVERERLLKAAVASRRLDCGCEHHQYGWMLLNVGRVTEALDQLRQANDMLALYVYTPLNLADALVASGKYEEARTYFDAAAALAPDAEFARYIEAEGVMATGDLKRLDRPGLAIDAARRRALAEAYRARGSGDAAAKSRAVAALRALPETMQDDTVARLLAELGAGHEAFLIAARRSSREYPGPSVFWYRGMRPALDDPGFPALAEKAGLLRYWRATKTRPDVCKETRAPAFCRLI